jgi:hypothetical protein
MAEKASLPVFNVVYLDADTDKRTPIGTVAMEPDGRLRQLTVLPARQTYLENVLARMNREEQLNVSVPPADDAPRFQMRSRIVKRSDPDFVDALKGEMAKYFGLLLEPETAASQKS